MKFVFSILLSLFLPFGVVRAVDVVPTDVAENASVDENVTDNGDDYIPITEFLKPAQQIDTKCSTGVFAEAMAKALSDADSEISQEEIEPVVYSALGKADTLRAVLECPELVGYPEDEPIKFLPIRYTFDTGRVVTVNYETEIKILKQRIKLAEKRGLPVNDPNPEITPFDENVVWTNTDPAWYGILVVQAGTLDEFVGTDKNNTLSVKYLADNFDDFYPPNGVGSCTTRSGISGKHTMISDAVRMTVDMESQTGERDKNNYYIAGDINLQWISYSEIALDVVITVATFGGGTWASGTLKAMRSSKAMAKLSDYIKFLKTEKEVVDYIKVGNKVGKVKKEIDAINALNKIDEITKTINGLDKVKDAKKIAKLEKELDKAKDITKNLKNIDRLKDAETRAKQLENLEKEVEDGGKLMKDMEKKHKKVKEYNKAISAFEDLHEYRKALRGLRRGVPHTGNVIARAFKAAKASLSGGKKISKGAKIARQGLKSGRLRDWLFHSTMSNVESLIKLEAVGGALYSTMKFLGNMYDYTETSTGEFTNDIEFKPLGLLSADDLPEQDNVVNYGMWLMWQGDSTSAADDDAAYLQAMDFAAKTAEDLTDLQQKQGYWPCKVDLYVVRPIIQNPGSENAQLYYLIMNDEPWRVTPNQ